MEEEIDYGSGVPPYLQLAAILRAKIESGEYAGKLPSGRTLSQQYEVAIGTVRKALAVLRGEGLIHTAQGWGVSVVPPERRPGSGNAPS